MNKCMKMLQIAKWIFSKSVGHEKENDACSITVAVTIRQNLNISFLRETHLQNKKNKIGKRNKN